MELPYPTEVNEWTWSTIESLAGEDEGQYLEFKSDVHTSESTEQAQREWRKKLEREIVAFANANGGLIVFGVSDGGRPALFEPPDHEVKQSVTRLISNTTPPVNLDISDPIYPPSDDTDRMALVVRIHEADRKPVTTSDSAVYIRVNDRKEPMTREQMEAIFVANDRRQLAVRQLELEIDRFHEAIHGTTRNFSVHGEAPPDFHVLNIDSLKEVLQTNIHLYSDQDLREAIMGVFSALREIEDHEMYYQRTVSGETDSHHSSRERFHRDERQNLKRKVDRVERELTSLAELAGLDVELLGE